MNGRNGSFHDSVTKRLGGQRRWDIRRYFEVRVDGCVLAILKNFPFRLRQSDILNALINARAH